MGHMRPREGHVGGAQTACMASLLIFNSPFQTQWSRASTRAGTHTARWVHSSLRQLLYEEYAPTALP
eukprot:210307-Rhodomonas_salina.2